MQNRISPDISPLASTIRRKLFNQDKTIGHCGVIRYQDLKIGLLEERLYLLNEVENNEKGKKPICFF